MAKDFWIPTSAELRRQCSTKLLETEKDFWMTVSEMHHGMLESIFEAVRNGDTITLRRNGVTVSMPPADRANSTTD